MEQTDIIKIEKKPVSLYQLFNEDREIRQKIEIPIIQRDYAQGRKNSEVNRIRKQFLDVLYKALIDNKYIQLDFIYGAVEDKKLIPLDGQQRLTTLFLLHWYISRNEKIPDAEVHWLSEFTYHTRYSTEKFCNMLIRLHPELNSVIELSTYIKDQFDFIESWKNDPTVDAMLNMLDDIHIKFKDTDGLWAKLTDGSNSPISFYFLSLDEFKMTDTLYVKMNSRGKPLTEFEHFKAYFEDVVNEVYDELKLTIVSQKFDSIWTDLFWKYRGDNNIIDEEFMRYFRFLSEALAWKNNVEILKKHDCFEIVDLLYNCKENLDFFEQALDAWCGLDIQAFYNEHFLDRYDNFSQYEPGKICIYTPNLNYFDECCTKYGEYKGNNRSFPLNDILMLYAVLYYLMNKSKVSNEEFKDRLRIVRNLVFNSQFEIREKNMGLFIQDIEDIILNGTVNQDDRTFNKLQKDEEVRKSAWKIAYPDFIDKMNFLEDHQLLRGSISIIDYTQIEYFPSRCDCFYKIFPPNGLASYPSLRKVLLAIGDYGQLISGRYSYGGNSEGTWRDLLTPSQQRNFFSNTKQYITELLDMMSSATADSSLLDRIVDNYLSNSIKDWRYYIVKYDEMRFGAHGMYVWRGSNNLPNARKNNYELYMMNTPSSLSGKHWDPFLFTLFKRNSTSFKLEDLGEDLYFIKYDCFVKCNETEWIFRRPDYNEFYRLQIPQDENGIDQIDRIDFFENSIMSESSDAFSELLASLSEVNIENMIQA